MTGVLAMQILVTAGFVLAAFFPAMLFLRSDWNANPPIRSTFLFSIIVALVMFLAMLRSFGVMLPGWVRLGIYALIVVGLALQDITVIRTQNRRAARIAREREYVKEPTS